MRKLFGIIFFVFFTYHSFSQIPGTKLIKYIKKSPYGQIFYDLKPTSDNGYIAVGSDSFFNYDKNAILRKQHGNQPWIVKLNNNGNVVWSRVLSVYQTGFNSVVQSSDGGFVAAGYNQETSPPYDTSRFYIAKYSATGTLLWQKLYGGTFEDVAYSIVEKGNTGYMVAGYTESGDGDVIGNHSWGYADVWLMQTDLNGNTVWKKCFGGTHHDTAFAVVQTPDKGFVIVGSSQSSNGDLTGNNGSSDAWIFKIDSVGNLIWQKNFGGSGFDAFRSIAINGDGNFIVTGFTKSITATSNGNKGKADVWVAKISSNGDMMWSKGFGGAEDEMGLSIVLTQDNSFLVSGYTESIDADVTGSNGLSDIWLIKVSNDGNLVWQKCIGTNKNEIAMAVHYNAENDYLVAGVAEPIVPPIDEGDGYVAWLGNTAHIKGNLISTETINKGVFQAIKSGIQYATIPFNNVFKIDVDTGVYNAAYSFPFPYYTVTPSSTNVNLPNYFDTVQVNFTVQAIPGVRDLNIIAFPIDAARPGRSLRYKLIYGNVGTDTVSSGTILFKKDSRLNFVSANPAISSSNGDTLKWNYSNLTPFDTAHITVNFQVPAPPVVNITDTLISVAIVTPGNMTPQDDTVLIRQRVIGSIDPNDKTENFDGTITPEQVLDGNYIHYLIRFQNTGTDTAFDITIRDTLDSKLDWNSFEMVASSHTYQLSIKSQSRLGWVLPDIKLVDSFHNEPASHGYILYRIKPNTSLIVGDTIKNSASIYFDFNPPVKTNTTKTEVNNHFVLTCPSGNVNIVAFQTGDSYQWQVDEGNGFIDVVNSSVYNGSTSNTLTLTAPPTSWYGYKYRCVINSAGDIIYSPVSALKFHLIWNGTINHDWSSPDNWNCGVLPDNYTDVIIPAGVANYPEININASCRSLLLQPTSSLTVKPGFRLDIYH